MMPAPSPAAADAAPPAVIAASQGPLRRTLAEFAAARGETPLFEPPAWAPPVEAVPEPTAPPAPAPAAPVPVCAILSFVPTLPARARSVAAQVVFHK